MKKEKKHILTTNSTSYYTFSLKKTQSLNPGRHLIDNIFESYTQILRENYKVTLSPSNKSNNASQKLKYLMTLPKLKFIQKWIYSKIKNKLRAFIKPTHDYVSSRAKINISNTFSTL